MIYVDWTITSYDKIISFLLAILVWIKTSISKKKSPWCKYINRQRKKEKEYCFLLPTQPTLINYKKKKLLILNYKNIINHGLHNNQRKFCLKTFSRLLLLIIKNISTRRNSLSFYKAINYFFIC